MSSTLRLDGLQEGLQDYVLTPKPGHAIQAQVASDTQASAEFRLQVYAEAYRLRLEEALETDFEGMHSLLGDEQFHALCLRYVDAHPSTHYSLRYFGRYMSDFLRATSPYAAQGVLADLARFEWSLIDAFDAPDDQVVTVEDMARFAPEAWPLLRFEVHASVQHLKLNWNAPRIWAAIKDQQTPPAPEKYEPPASWLVWRQNYQSYYRPLSGAEVSALECARAGKNFAEVCEDLCQQMAEEETAAVAAGFLHRWISDGLVSEVASSEII
ncbi:MAG: DNA-binding domain-containing protein [Gammaproteobacteria bacterium]